MNTAVAKSNSLIVGAMSTVPVAPAAPMCSDPTADVCGPICPGRNSRVVPAVALSVNDWPASMPTMILLVSVTDAPARS